MNDVQEIESGPFTDILNRPWSDVLCSDLPRVLWSLCTSADEQTFCLCPQDLDIFWILLPLAVELIRAQLVFFVSLCGK